MNDYTFREFIQSEIDKRGSQQDFADATGISQSTISRWLNPKKKHEPDLKTLMKLSEVTGKSIEALVVLAYPELADKTKLSASSRIVAQTLEELPESIQTAIIAIIKGSPK